MRTKEIQLSRIVDMEDPQSVLGEVRETVLMMLSEFDFEALNRVFKDIVCLFQGEYPGYRKCTTEYHDLKHTTDAFLAMARLMHGAAVAGESLSRQQVNLGLICALMHDTGYIQTRDDDVGTGAKYALVDTRRSIAFMEKYLTDNAFSKEDFKGYPDILNCTGLDKTIDGIQFGSPDIEVLGKMLGTADLLGQMADRTYLEKLLFLFYEFREGGVLGFNNELDLLKKTTGFYAMARSRFSNELGSMNEYIRYHFKARWGVDRDLYMEAIEKNINYAKFLVENHQKDYRAHLRRDHRYSVEKIKEKEDTRQKSR